VCSFWPFERVSLGIAVHEVNTAEESVRISTDLQDIIIQANQTRITVKQIEVF
jgi:hypothetical protein